MVQTPIANGHFLETRAEVLAVVVAPYRRAPKRAKQLSMATIPLCFEFFRCRVDVLQ